jgi:hypothetical protein
MNLVAGGIAIIRFWTATKAAAWRILAMIRRPSSSSSGVYDFSDAVESGSLSGGGVFVM